MYHLSIVKVLRPFAAFALFLIVVLSLFRIIFAFWQLERINDLNMLITMMMNGLRIDLSSIAYLLFIPALIHPFITLSKYNQVWEKLLSSWFFVCFFILLFFELSTPAFIHEYGLRPNRLFIEYLVYPREVASMLVNGHLSTLVVVNVLLIMSSCFYWFLINKSIFKNTSLMSIKPSHRVFSWCVLILVLFAFARGTFGHRPINPSFVYFTTDPLLNSLTLNSAYSVAFALKQLGNEKDSASMYGKMPDDQIIHWVRKETGLPMNSFKNNRLPSLSKRIPSYKGKLKNLVIVLEESLGAQFVGSLGGLPLTPHLDKLIAEGWGFSNLYATGTRSVRGIEAVITGFTPTPARAVVKLDKSQRDFFTIASLLKRHGYKTQFIYGGESHFDNMKSFFLGNGFDEIVDFDDIESPEFVASWGASDGDLFNQANIELTKLYEAKKPFFSLIFTSSNHDPFEVPQGNTNNINYTSAEKLEYDDKEIARHKAIQYADYALGQFIKQAKTQAYWENTIFLIVSDHDARVIGVDLVPVKNFHIPAVILNSGKNSILDNRLVSQIDLAPTLISLMGIENETPMLGYDLTKKHFQERALMQYANNFAYILNNEVVILQPEMPPLFFNYDLTTKKLSAGDENLNLAKKALSHALWGSLSYRNQWYQLPNNPGIAAYGDQSNKSMLQSSFKGFN